MAKRKLPQEWRVVYNYAWTQITSKGVSYIVFISAVDVPIISIHRWNINNYGYAITTNRLNGVKKGTLMHRLILDADVGQEIDHENHRQLDNRRSNIRFCTRQQNLMNGQVRRDNKAGLKGVWFDESRNKYQAYININGKRQQLGRFVEKVDAAIAYDDAAINMFGDFARTNKSMGLI